MLLMTSVSTTSSPQRTDTSAILNLRKPITVDAIRKGLPVRVVESLGKRLSLPTVEMTAALRLPRQTYIRRREAGRLSPDESDRVVRYADLLARATDLFGSESDAARWLSRPAPALNGETPINYAMTELGAKQVFNLIGRLEHGIPT